MSQHKYNDAYNKGFEDGKKKAFDDWVYQCYDELSPKEQIELLLSEGAELPRKAVIKALGDVRSGIRERIEESVRKTWFEGSTVRCGMYEAIDIIDRKIKEIKGEQK